MISTFVRRFGATLRWLLFEPWVLWSSLAVPALAWLVAVIVPGQPEFRVRVAATIISAIGVFLVVHQILSTQRLFERPNVVARVAGWFDRGRGIWAGAREIHASGDATLRFEVKASGVVMRHSDGSTDSRLRILEERVEALDASLAAMSQSLDARIADVKEAIQKEGVLRTSELARLSHRLDSVAADGFAVEVFGVALLIWGQVFSTFPEELGRWLP